MTTDLRSQLQTTLGTSYTLERELGGGGMSRVFVASENRLRRSVVIKVLSTELAAGVSADRFEREIQLAASLQQANIVPLLSAGETGGIPYYSMPLVDGQSLRARLGREGRLPVAECVNILRDVARALSYAHAHGVVHRDIKPDNILLSHGAAVVTDFGIAKAISAARTRGGGGETLTQAGTAIGTPAYMAPEQVAGDNAADHRIDIYAFGCVAYELLTGRPPFSESSPQKLLMAHLGQAPQPVRELRSDVPGALATLVMQCLEKQANDRPSTADHLLRSLEGIATPSGGYQSGIASSQRGKPWWRTTLGIATVIGFAAVLGAIAMKGPWASPTPEDTSIAVMPLNNISGDTANNYFGEGLAEEITGALAKAGLHVIGRGSARALGERGLDARAIASQLGVATVLQGSVRRSGDQLRITMQLMSGSDGSVRWTQKYDRRLQDVFAVQDEIARSIVSELRVTLGAGTMLVRTETTDPEAHALYLQGLYLWNRRTAPAIHQAIRLFDGAVARDSNYARAHAGIALAFTVLPYYEDGNADSLRAIGRAAADRALALDSTLAEAWTARAFGSTAMWKNSEAERDFQRALQSDSTFATGRFWYSLLLDHLGREDDATRERDAAGRLEPTSLVIRSSRAQQLMGRRRFDEARALTDSILAIDSSFALATWTLGWIETYAGHHDEAVRVLRAASAVPGVRASEVKGTLAHALARAGRAAEARAVLAEIRRSNAGKDPPTGAVAAAQFELGDREAALATLKAAIDQHDPWLVNYGRGPRYDKLRSDPAAKALLESTERP
jgi:serine/threonine-protein kinase